VCLPVCRCDRTGVAMTSHVLVANCSGGGACAVPYQLLTSSSDHVIDDVTAASPGRGGLWDVLRTALLGALAMSTDGVVAQRQGVRFAIKRSRVRSPARARLRTTTLGKLFIPTCLDADSLRYYRDLLNRVPVTSVLWPCLPVP